ncbi:MAG: 30S ribosomal protein S20 [Deltaproteobacteria bacterium]
MATKKKPTRHRSALKAQRQALKRNLNNRSIKKGLRLTARAAGDAAAAKDSTKASHLLGKASSALDKAAKTGAIHWKAAARKKARLARRLSAQLSGAAPAAA